MQNLSSVVLGLLCCVLGAGLLYNGITLQRLEARLVAIEQAPPAKPAAATAQASSRRGEGLGTHEAMQRRVRPRSDAARAGAPSSESADPVDLEDPEVREELAAIVEETQERRWEERRAEWAARWTRDMNDEVDHLAQVHGWSSDTVESVRKELDDMHALSQAIREDAWSGDLSRFQAREDMEQVREATAARLQSTLGPDAFEAVQDRFLTSHRGGRM